MLARSTFGVVVSVLALTSVVDPAREMAGSRGGGGLGPTFRLHLLGQILAACLSIADDDTASGVSVRPGHTFLSVGVRLVRAVIFGIAGYRSLVGVYLVENGQGIQISVI
jgi:hypothetical protein